MVKHNNFKREKRGEREYMEEHTYTYYDIWL